MDSIQSHIFANNWEYWYYIFLSFMIVVKYVFKKIARNIDTLYVKIYFINHTHDHDIDDPNYHHDNQMYFLSFEWLNELYFSMVYWRVYRVYVCNYLPSLSVFITSIFFHLLSDIIESCVKISTIYYTITKDVIILRIRKSLYLNDHNNDHNNNPNYDNIDHDVQISVIKMFIRNIVGEWWLYDDSTVIEWQTRCSIDIVTRLFVAVLASIAQACQLFAVGRAGYESLFDTNKEDNRKAQEQNDKAQLYNVISLIIEVVYFC